MCVLSQVCELLVKEAPAGSNYIYKCSISSSDIKIFNWRTTTLILWSQPYSLTWRNINIQPNRTFFWWDEPQLTSVTELSEQKLPLVTPPTCTVISALIVLEKPLAGVTVRSPKVHRLSLSVQCAFTECRATNRQPAQDTGGREGGTEQTPGANIKCERGQDSWGCWGADGEVINTSGPGQHTGVDYRLKVRGKDIVTLCDDTVWHVCRVCWLWE